MAGTGQGGRGMSTRDSAARLRVAVDDAVRMFGEVDEARTMVRPAPGKWCAREILGHLIDSACNNHRRFVLGHAATTSRWDEYEQEHWVRCQQYAEQRWVDLMALWTAYNRHLAHCMAVTPAAVAAREATAPDGMGQLSVAYLMDDYVTHMSHHVAQIGALLKG
jgi:hypothetical protein